MVEHERLPAKPEVRETYTVGEAADRLGIGRPLAYRLAREGRLPTLRLGHRVVVPRERLARMLEGRE
jgi:excisionase family DNA binding protein